MCVTRREIEACKSNGWRVTKGDTRWHILPPGVTMDDLTHDPDTHYNRGLSRGYATPYEAWVAVVMTYNGR